jgi:hypothetical protein
LRVVPIEGHQRPVEEVIRPTPSSSGTATDVAAMRAKSGSPRV